MARRLGVLFLHPFRRKCNKQRRSALCKHPLYSPKLHRFCEKQATVIHARCGPSSGKICGIIAEDILAQFLAQGGRCALSGQPLKFDRLDPAETKVSVDRIDSSLNYTADNVQLVTARINQMKNDMSQATFVKICLLVADHAMSTVERGERAA
ncbi:hypothetical protein HY379_02380 [Candidatus Saccharibacteria bacterium]|nr:hypothetical protein [Candidatus Saccharibacteria bacterium]